MIITIKNQKENGAVKNEETIEIIFEGELGVTIDDGEGEGKLSIDITPAKGKANASR